MATALDTYLFYDTGAGANVAESGWRDAMRHMLGSASGVIRGFLNDFNTFGDSSGMQVKVNTGECWIRGQYGKNSSIKTLGIAAAHASLARKDRVILRNDFVANRIELDVLTGTAAASPTTPSVSQTTALWETSLAIVNVAAAASTISAANVVDDRVYTSAQARYRNSAAQALANNDTSVKLQFNTDITISGDVQKSTSNTDFTLLRPGLWCIQANCVFSTATTGIRYLWISKNGENNTDRLGQAAAPASASGDTALNCTATHRFTTNEVVCVYVFQNSGGSINTNVAERGVNVTFTWMGP